ncbi:MAG: cell division topological specificity factor MinE [Chloroflexi bacterium]|nr:cell division topological specificity factor MinE [Anaerolineae bacterium]RLC71255.1 MAG: cell division topological specificity factor MinE [Chloroflexota bacterium]HIP96123.1 cell division topological specificity factor MinE [Anaerolineae bacterium]
MSIWDKLLGRREPTSREVARERLQLVLVHDRAKISPQLLQTLKDEIIAVISRHVDIDREGVEVTFTRSRRQSRLVANIPLQGSRQRRK